MGFLILKKIILKLFKFKSLFSKWNENLKIIYSNNENSKY